MFLKIAVLFIALARAERPPRFDNHIGGVYDTHRGAYVPGSGTGAPRVGERVHPPAPPVATPPPVPENATVHFAEYSHGDENIESQRIRVSLVTVPRPEGGVSLAFRFRSTLSANDPTMDYILSHATLYCQNATIGRDLAPAPARLFTEHPADRTLIGTTYTQQVLLGATLSRFNPEYVYGDCSIVAGGRALQTFLWGLTIGRDGRMRPTFVPYSPGQAGPRDPRYRQVESSWATEGNVTPFPTRAPDPAPGR